MVADARRLTSNYPLQGIVDGPNRSRARWERGNYLLVDGLSFS
jgi:hypothetical protein